MTTVLLHHVTAPHTQLQVHTQLQCLLMQSGSAGEFLMALVMGLAYDEIEELMVCIGAHAEGGDHTDLMVW